MSDAEETSRPPTPRAEEIAAHYMARQGDGATELDQLIQDAILGAGNQHEEVSASAEEAAEIGTLIARLGKTPKQHSRRRRTLDRSEGTPLEQLHSKASELRIIKQGKLLKEGSTALVRRSAWREVILLNKALLVAEEKDDGHLALKRVVWFENGITIDLRALLAEDAHPSFELLTSEKKCLRFLQATEDTSLSAWATAIADALCTALGSECNRHEIVTGTLWWFALYAPLHNAEKIDHEDYLKNKSAGLMNKIDTEGMTPCHLAASKENRETALRMLLVAGADASAAAGPGSLRPGETPLHVAARYGQAGNAAVLVAFGADASRTDSKGQTAFEAAVGSGLVDAAHTKRKHLLRMLPRPSFVPGALHLCARRGLANNAKTLISLGFFVDELDLHGETPLHAAAAVPHTEAALCVLFDAGAAPNKKNADRLSALDLALDSRIQSGLGHQGNAAVIANHGGRPAASSSRATTPTKMTANEKQIKNWPSRELPAVHDQNIRAILYAADKAKWTPDAAQSECQLCDEPFNNLNRRRHHCRSCGHLCCAPCSTKQAHLYFSNERITIVSVTSSNSSQTGSNPSTTNRNKHDAANEAPYWSKERVCDCCFNRLDALLSGRSEEPADVKVSAVEASSFANDDNALSTHQICQRKANDTAQDLADLGNELRERGEKLENIADRSQEMANTAHQFRENTRRLREAYEKKQKTRFAFLF